MLVRPAATMLLTDIQKHARTALASTAAQTGVTLIHHTESDRQHRFPGIARSFFPDYEMAMIREPVNHLGSASHILMMEWDAGVLNPMAWEPWFLQWDYIGAPWPQHNLPGWPPCDGVTNAVGNSGFSLRSRRFCEAVCDALEAFKNDDRKFCHDAWMCRTIKPWLEERGIKFAPVEVAQKFSCENRIYAGQFGFHGRSTAKLNNWGGWFDQFRDRPTR